MSNIVQKINIYVGYHKYLETLLLLQIKIQVISDIFKVTTKKSIAVQQSAQSGYIVLRTFKK